MTEWLLSPIDPTRPHDVALFISWHGRLMVLAWVVLIPVGIIMARYFKVTPRQDWPNELDNKIWWHTHRLTQYTGAVLTIFALGLVLLAPFNATRTDGAVWHRIVGIVVVLLVVAQIIGAVLRGSKGGPTAPAPDGSFRGDHYDMTLHRRAFELLHKTGGYASLILSAAAVFLGLWQANALIWMWIALGGWYAMLLLAFCILELTSRKITTYQAIWGHAPQETDKGL